MTGKSGSAPADLKLYYSIERIVQIIKKKAPGIALCAAVAAVATVLCGVKLGSFSLEIVGAPVFSILLGMIITLCAPKLAASDTAKTGVKFTSKKILQWAVIILGFSLNMSTIAKVGAKSLPVIVCTISTSLIVAYLMMKALKLNSKVACLIGVGSSICGGSAIAATAPVIDASDEEYVMKDGDIVIFLFNVLAALIFPYLGHAIGFGSGGFAVFAGTAVNDTSSVTAAASTAESIYGVDGILSSAVTVKLTRTLAIIPITLVLALWRTAKAKKAGGSAENAFSFKKAFPFFIVWFVLAALVTTGVGLLPESGFVSFYGGSFVPAMKWLAKFFIAMAMAAIGLNTNIVSLIKNGGKPILLGFCCWLSISAVSILVQLATHLFYTSV